MMPLYPTFEDLKVDELVQAQVQGNYAHAAEFMGLNLDAYCYNDHGQLVPVQANRAPATTPAAAAAPPLPPVATPAPATRAMVAAQGAGALVPVNAGPGEIRQGVRQIVLCKDGGGKVGIQLMGVDNGVFTSFVKVDSPAAMGGLRFGDQVISICGHLMAGRSGNKAMHILRKSSDNNIELLVRDRPFERTMLVNKSSTGDLGMTINNGMITAIVKDSSAARNGVLTSHQIVEVNGQNVMGVKDKMLKELLQRSPSPIRLTILPEVIYKHLIKKLCKNQMCYEMDRSLPEA